jgi:hypothetical protein
MENDTDIIINGSEATWIMPRTDGELGGTYTGTFIFRCFLDPLRQLQAGREYRELLGSLGAQASESEGNISFALCQVKNRLIKGPPFWTSTLQESGMSGNIGDLNIIAMVLDAAIRSENLFKEKIAKERESALDRGIKVGEEILHAEDVEE